MPIITLTTDFGYLDPHVAILKAKILKENPKIQIVDISHQVHVHDVAHAAYLFNGCYDFFSEGTIHLIAVNNQVSRKSRFLLAKLDNHLILVEDNGFLGLLKSEIQALYEIHSDSESKTFAALSHLLPAALKIARGTDIGKLGNLTTEYYDTRPRMAKVTKKEIVGHVEHIDHYGNLITNIFHEDFKAVYNNRKFMISFGIEKFDKIHQSYNEVEGGDCFILFNSLDRLQIGIKHGRACELLGLGRDSLVSVHFLE